MEVAIELVAIQLTLGSVPGRSNVEASETNVPPAATQYVVNPLHLRGAMPTYQEQRLRDPSEFVARLESGAFDSQSSLA